MDCNNNKVVKIIVVGETFTGKTSLTKRWTEDEFNKNELITVGIDFTTKIIQIDGVGVKVILWDTAGQERFRTITHAFYRGAEGVFLVYNVNCEDSFNKITYWLSEVNANCYEQDIVKVLIANKIDEEDSRKVSLEEGLKLAEQHGLVYREVSAKTSEGTQFALEDMLNKILEMEKLRECTTDVIVIKKQKRWKKKKGSAVICKCNIL